MKILYAPGIGKELAILQCFRNVFLSNGHSIDVLSLPYDSGSYCQEIKKLSLLKYDWWIGISLGASILCSMLSIVDKNFLPNKLIAINPFYDRQVLSVEKNFSMDGQWRISLSENIGFVENFDLCLSVFDKSIPLHHGLEVLNTIKSTNKRLITVDSDHQINCNNTQIQLAKLLLNTEGNTITDEHNYCHVYKR